jgi:hypothetical protein
MEWNPNQEGIKELLKLFKESQQTDNTSQRIVFEVFFCNLENKHL